MTDIKQVKVDNWGIYFLQRLKHFFNRTDYCDLTLQFQDNAQLKVHRLVLNACTEYFELLERTCEMYEDCLVMPDDLQADVVVPIVNFMYTGHLEFRMDLLERLYQTSQILNMPVLTKLLEAHRISHKGPSHFTHSYSSVKRFSKASEPSKIVKPTTSHKRSYSKAFDTNIIQYREKKVNQSIKIPEPVSSPSTYRPPSPIPEKLETSISNKKPMFVDPRPTRYELPEELDNDNIFDNSFCNISYTCKPLMVHPENLKRYSAKRTGIFSEASSSKKLLPGTSTVDIVECKRISKDDNIFDDSIPDHSMNDDLDIFQSSYNTETTKDSSQLFDQILDDGPKVTIETKNSKTASNLDHAKIISEVLKKYPHLVKSNKNIKLKILNTPSKGKKPQKASPTYIEDPEKLVKPKLKTEVPDYTYETDVIDSQQAAKLIALGAENVKGPWICLICGTPGKALHFTSYYKFRRHLVEVHNEKPVSNICEYCGLRSLKRNYLLHHLYSQHGVEPPPQYHFPKCNRCNYIALTEGLLVKHKMTHKDVKNFRCNVCSAPFTTTKQLLQHIQVTGHKYCAERKANLQCIYCLKSFLRDGNLYAHLKTYHRKEARSDGIIEDSDDEIPPQPVEETSRMKMDNRDGKYHHIKYEPMNYDNNDYEEVDVQYQIQQRHDGDIQFSPRKQHNVISNAKQKILNPGFGTPKPPQKAKPVRKPAIEPPNNFLEDMNIPSPPTTNTHNEEEIVLIDNTEYIMRDNQLIPRKSKTGNSEYIISDMIEPASLQAVQPTTSMAYTEVHNPKILEDPQPSIVMKKTSNINQPIQIVVSNEEEYKALMASNHPLLFDNGDANKTLTMLTAPHNSTIDTAAIDLDNAQSNDMMIIQEDYPLNVTEAVSTDNSNIVVVYSHPVDQNKQYQILTTGGIGSQFVQSSAILTQNYETVTTTTPVMSAHALPPQAETSWQENVPSGGTQRAAVNPQPELHNVVQDVAIKPCENVSVNNLSELPEVHLTPIPQPIVPQQTQVSDTSDALIIANSEDIDQAIVQEIEDQSQNIAETQMATDILRDSIAEQEAAMIVPMQISHELMPAVISNDINQQVQDASQNIQGVNQDIHGISQDIHAVGQDIHDVSQDMHDVSQDIHDVSQDIHDVTEDIHDVNQDIHDVSQDIHNVNQAVCNESQEVHNMDQEIHDVNQEVHNVSQQIPDVNRDIHDVRREIRDVNQDIHEVRQKVHDVNQEMHDPSSQDSEISQAVHAIQGVENQIEPQCIAEQSTTEITTPEEQAVTTLIATENSGITENIDLHNTQEDQEPLPESQAYDDIVEINNQDAKEVPQPYIKKTEEKVQNLALEWSEDEYDVHADAPTTVANIPNPVEVSVPSQQLEESIENINMEVQKHITDGNTLSAAMEPLPDVDTEESEASISEDTVPSPREAQLTPVIQAPAPIVQPDPETQEKITSLLNDWEDNDSQEENNSDVPTEENKDETEDTLDKAPKNDNIKSLVSDWDDEEEEIKEN